MKILFVCTGNTCRSCMAEAIFNNLCEWENITAASAGLSIVPGSMTSVNSAKLVVENIGVDISNRRAVQATEAMFREADLILTMTSYMASIIKNTFLYLSEKVFSINEYVSINGDISDPYGGDLEIYRNTYEDMNISINLLLKKLREDKGI